MLFRITSVFGSLVAASAKLTTFYYGFEKLAIISNIAGNSLQQGCSPGMPLAITPYNVANVSESLHKANIWSNVWVSTSSTLDKDQFIPNLCQALTMQHVISTVCSISMNALCTVPIIAIYYSKFTLQVSNGKVDGLTFVAGDTNPSGMVYVGADTDLPESALVQFSLYNVVTDLSYSIAESTSIFRLSRTRFEFAIPASVPAGSYLLKTTTIDFFRREGSSPHGPPQSATSTFSKPLTVLIV